MRYSSVEEHKKSKDRLITPINQLDNVEIVSWTRDFLPEHIWIDLLSNSYSDNVWPRMYSSFLDAMDEYTPSNVLVYGFISDFGLIPESKREEFGKKNERLIHDVFLKPIGRIIAFYPDAPCYWLLSREYLQRGGSLDPQTELARLDECVLRLFPGKDLHAGHIRAVPLGRMFKHNRIKIREGVGPTELLGKYPVGCTDDEKYRVQQFARSVMNMRLQTVKHYQSWEWSKYFWRHNFDIVPCRPNHFNPFRLSSPNSDDEKALHTLLSENARNSRTYLSKVSRQYRYDLYEPERDEIILALFSRVTRLYVLMLSNSSLWSQDIAGIMLRCLADTAITFTYLVQKGTEQDFEEFKVYSQSKEKLLMLYIQDDYPDKKAIDGRTVQDIAEDLGGGFTPELIDIKLSNWTKKSVRKLALSCGLEELYRLVYAPASSDLHGAWISLRESNMVSCGQPLHRFHRIPEYFVPPLHLDTFGLVQEIYLSCVHVGMEELEFPNIEGVIEEIKPILDNIKTGNKDV